MDDLFGLLPESVKESLDVGFLEILQRQTERNIEASNNEQQVKKLFQFAKNSQFVKSQVCDVSKIVLANNGSGVLHDFRLDCKGPDDRLYLKHQDIREKITRGLSILEYTDANGLKTLDLVVYANRKFSGGTGDDDDYIADDDNSWQNFCLQSPDLAKSVVCTAKLNGEAGHLSGRFIDGKFYYFIGSKNVHMMLRGQEDICLYTEPRYRMAIINSKAILQSLSALQPDCLLFLQNYLHQTKVTIVMEIMQPDYQHIIDLSHLETVTPSVLMFTPTLSDISSTSLTAIVPHVALSLSKALGLLTTTSVHVLLEDVPVLIKKIRRDLNTEGSVLYYLDETQETIGLIKVKSCWYVLLRALREKVDRGFPSNRKTPPTLKETITKTKKRFDEIQTWLHFSDEYLAKWKRLAERFLKWIANEIENQRVDPKEIRPKYPMIWKRFLRETRNSDDFS